MFKNELLKEFREKAGLSIDDIVFALREKKIEKSGQTVRNWESGDTEPSATELKALAEIYKKPLIAFYN